MVSMYAVRRWPYVEHIARSRIAKRGQHDHLPRHKVPVDFSHVNTSHLGRHEDSQWVGCTGMRAMISSEVQGSWAGKRHGADC